MRYLPAVLLLALLPSLAQAQTTAVRPSQIVPGTPDLTVTVPAGSNNVVIGSTVTWRADSTTTPTICTGSGTGSGSGAASCTASDAAKILELTNAGAITATLPSVSDGYTFVVQMAAGTLTLSPPASASINSQTTSVTIGPYQSVSLSARGGNWYAGLWAAPPVSSGPAAIAHVKSVSGTATSSGTSVTFPTFAAIGAGNSVVGQLAFGSSSNIISSIAMGSNTFTTFEFSNYGGTYSAITFALHNITGAPTALTVTFTTTPGATAHYYSFDEYSGGSAIGAQHASLGISATSTTLTVPAITTTVANAWIYSGLLGATPAITYPGSFTTRLNDTTNKFYSADIIEATAGPYSVVWGYASSTSTYGSSVSISP